MPHPTTPAAVRHPDFDALVVLDPAVDYDPSDVVVKLYPQFFRAIENGHDIVESVSVESASAAPGEKRSRTRSK